MKFIFLNSAASKILFYDVGQGDAILIKLQDYSLLIDGGPNFEISSYISELSLLNTCALTALLLTHPHADHLQGLTRILDRCNVKTYFVNPIQYDSKLYLSFMNAITKPQELYAGNTFKLGRASIYVLWPPKSLVSSKSVSNVNDLSTVILLDIGNFEALFTGDIEDYALQHIDYKAYADVIQNGLDVLKVPHHGGETSLHEKFYEFFKPKICVLSYGFGNSYHHPHKKVLDYLNKINCTVRKTEEEGNIEILIDRL